MVTIGLIPYRRATLAGLHLAFRRAFPEALSLDAMRRSMPSITIVSHP